MLFDYDLESPEWAESEEYLFCRNLTEKKVLRVVLTWLTFVNQRYRPQKLKLDSYSVHSDGCIRGTQMERHYNRIANAIPDDRDPAHFVSSVFELWENRDKYHIYAKNGIEELAGLSFPSLKSMYTNADKLATIWLAIPDYKPRDFVPLDDLRKRDTEIIGSKVTRWCTAYSKQPYQYWIDPRQVQLLDARYMKFSTSLLECREEVEKYWVCTVEELISFMEELQRQIEIKEDEIFTDKMLADAEKRKAGQKLEYANLCVLEDE